ncbi:MAG: hypothetical protein U9N44_03735 [Chloroflexota bacterium]|nr:hypothetical protein [Chloroflexota bacterium]
MGDAPALRRLFEPATIGTMRLKNRIVMPAMGTNMSDGGHVNRKILDHYEACARGGVGLIIVEVTGVDILPGAGCKGIADSGLTVVNKAGDIVLVEADTVIIATGGRPNNAVERELQGIVPELYAAGDCVRPEGIAEAVAASHLAALSI